MLEPAGMLAVFRDVLAAADLPARGRTDTDLEAVTRSDATTDYTFVLNHGRRPLSVDVPAGAEDLLAGSRYAPPLDRRETHASALRRRRARDTARGDRPLHHPVRHHRLRHQ